jgi:NADPH:quinone reductase-like Zn-dependent oxidoreductase
MKAISIHEFGGAEQLRLEEIEKPQPRGDKVLVKNAAAGINLACRSGRWRMSGTLMQAAAAPQAVPQIIQAEQAGIPAIWATSGSIEGGLLEWVIQL